MEGEVPLGAAHFGGAVYDDWDLLPGFPPPYLFLGHSFMKRPSCPHLKQPDCPSRHLPPWFLPHPPYPGAQLPPCATLFVDWVVLSLKFNEFLPLYSPLFLGVGALADDGVCPFCFKN